MQSVTSHAVLERSQELYQLSSQVLNCGINTYSNCVQMYGQNIIFLGLKTIQRAHLYHWEEYIQSLRSNGTSHWLSVLKVALEIFNGDLKGYVMLPDEKDVREALLKAFMKDLLKSSISE